MKKAAGIWAFVMLLWLSGAGYAQVDRSEEIAALMDSLNSASSARRVQAAKVTTQSGLVDPALYEKIATLLRAGYTEDIGEDHVDEMSWLCKALAASGDPQYKNLLQEIAERAPSFKLQQYARQSLGLIDEYAQRARILNATDTWDADLSDEDNRLLNMLGSSDVKLMRDAAKTVVRSITVHERVYDAVAAELLRMLADGRSGTLEIDTMSWLCKALAASGKGKYMETLDKVQAGTDSLKLKTYAAQARDQIE